MVMLRIHRLEGIAIENILWLLFVKFCETGW